MDERLALARDFLDRTDWAGIEPIPYAGDASARRYFRLSQPRPAVLMDAPPEAGQDVSQFAEIASLLQLRALSAPEIYARDDQSGFLLLEDLGDGVFAQLIAAEPKIELPLYRAAVDVLTALTQQQAPAGLPRCAAPDLAQMIAPVYEWYRWAVDGQTGEPTDTIRALETVLTPYPAETAALRDYHAENLIWLPERDGLRRVGLLDFQDAFVTIDGYDLVSLLLDARRDVSPHVIETVQAEYAAKRGHPPEAFNRAVAALGAQRNLRILGVFTRLALKYDKPRYLDFIPRVWRYVSDCVAHPGLEEVARCVRSDIPAPSPALLKDLRKRCGTVPDR